VGLWVVVGVMGNGLCLSLLGVHGGGPCHHHNGGANGTGNGVPCVNQVAEVAVDRQIPRATVVSTVGGFGYAAVSTCEFSILQNVTAAFQAECRAFESRRPLWCFVLI